MLTWQSKLSNKLNKTIFYKGDMDSVRQHIQTHTYTVDRARRYLQLLEDGLETVWYHSDQSTPVPERLYAALATMASPSELAVVKQWGTDWLTELSASNFKEKLQEVEAWVETAPRLTLYVPVALDEAAETTLGQWCRESLVSVQFLEWSVDANTVGGCAFISNDHYYDYSLTTRFHEQTEALRSIIASYAK